MRLLADIGTLAPYANLQIVKAGILTGDEKVKIARASLAAITWTGDQAPQITIDSRNAIAATSDRHAGRRSITSKSPTSRCLRIVKLASHGSAKPGEIIEFTLRVDNIGNREMGNVTVVDNLTTRLEYVPDSAKASVAADFSTEPNDGGSEVLRWELKEPLAKGTGCILQFKVQGAVGRESQFRDCPFVSVEHCDGLVLNILFGHVPLVQPLEIVNNLVSQGNNDRAKCSLAAILLLQSWILAGCNANHWFVRPMVRCKERSRTIQSVHWWYSLAWQEVNWNTDWELVVCSEPTRKLY